MLNERIRELADQAEDYATAEYEKWTPTPDFSGIPNVRKIFNKKFAELIIRKCAKVADLADENKCEWIGGNILTHFGVEE
jgi:hypothetical protein